MCITLTVTNFKLSIVVMGIKMDYQVAINRDQSTYVGVQFKAACYFEHITDTTSKIHRYTLIEII